MPEFLTADENAERFKDFRLRYKPLTGRPCWYYTLVKRQFTLILPPPCPPLFPLTLRLQYFARGSQSYHAQLQAALKGKSVLDMKDEQVSGAC